ncbi:MAG TPA: hypothetical protein VKX25_00745 [Bryobacteraceae bacterium]|jgi:hypothetical protein|nr:hypothetical protein [Bryobacteraceae bacterium]
MARTADTVRKFPTVPLICGAVALVCLIFAGIYFSRPSRQESPEQASAEAKAYLPNLALSDVSIQASENFMKQQVVEVKGNIANNGPKTLRSIEVYCIFSDTSGHEIYRERLPILSAKEAPLGPGEKRPFRLPFDALPDGWNQAMPRLVIAQIRFAD